MFGCLSCFLMPFCYVRACCQSQASLAAENLALRQQLVKERATGQALALLSNTHLNLANVMERNEVEFIGRSVRWALTRSSRSGSRSGRTQHCGFL